MGANVLAIAPRHARDGGRQPSNARATRAGRRPGARIHAVPRSASRAAAAPPASRARSRACRRDGTVACRLRGPLPHRPRTGTPRARAAMGRARLRWPSSTRARTGSASGRRNARTRAASRHGARGPRLGLGIGVFTMTATWVDGGYVNGTAEQTWSAGAALRAGALGLRAQPAHRRAVVRARHASPSLHDAARSLRTTVRHGAPPRCLYLPALTGEVFWTAAILTALGTTFGIILDLDFAGSIVLSAAVVIGLHRDGRPVGGRHHGRRAAHRPHLRP